MVGEPLAPQEPAAVEPVEPAWTGPSQEEWEQTQYALQQFQQQASQQQPEPQGPSQYPMLDPFSDDFTPQAVDLFRNVVREELAPIQEWQQTQRLQEAQDMALDIIDDDVQRNGEFRNPEKGVAFVQAFAATLVPQMSEKFGFGPKAAEAAITEAAKQYRELEQAVGTAFHEQEMNRLTNISGANRELGSQIPGAQQVVVEPGGDEMSVVRKYVGMQNAR